MREAIFKKIFKVFFFFFVVLIANPVYSQPNVEKATRETDILGRESIEKEQRLRRPPPTEKPPEIKAEEAPLKKEEQKFFIKKINLLGCESFSPQDFASIVEKYENKELTLSQLDALAKELEREYLRRGVIAAVFLPPQEIKEGTVNLQVVEARMGELEIQKHKYFKKERLSYYWKIPAGEIIRYDKISRSIQMMNKNPDREVKAALHAGKKVGTTDVLLTAKTRFPAHFTSTFDKEGSLFTGKSRIGMGLRDNNFLGLDDTLLSGYTWGREFSGLYAYHSLPINFNGTSLLYGYSQSESTPKKEYAVNAIKAQAKNTNLSLHQDLYKKDKYLGEVFVGFDAKDKRIRQDTGTTNRDRLRIFSLGGNFVQWGFGSTTTSSLELYQGVAAFGASSIGNSLASRGAKSNFTKFNLGIQHKRILPLNLQANLKFKSQISSTKLTPQEEFDLGGIDSVRGYPAADYMADNSVLTNAELLIPSIFIPTNWRLPYAKESLREQTTGVVFVDYGWGDRRGALPTEKKSVNFAGVGAGLRFKLFDQALLRLEWGFPVADSTITEAGRSRFHFSVDFQDRFPEETERIAKLIEEENIKQWAWQLVNEELSRLESPARKKLYSYLYLAQIAEQEGKFKESKEFYDKIVQLGKSLYRQAEDYVRGCIAQQKELKERSKLALGYYKEGKLTEAKDLWQKIIGEARPKPLILEF